MPGVCASGHEADRRASGAPHHRLQRRLRPPTRTAVAAGDAELTADGQRRPGGRLVFKTAADPYVGRLTYCAWSRARSRPTRTSGTRTRSATSASARSTCSAARSRSRCPELRPATSAWSRSCAHTATGDTLCDEGAAVQAASDRVPEPRLQHGGAPDLEGRRRQARAEPAAPRRGRPGPAADAATQSTGEMILAGLGDAAPRGDGRAPEAQVQRRGRAQRCRGCPTARRSRRRSRRTTPTRSRPAATASTRASRSRSNPLPRGSGPAVRRRRWLAAPCRRSSSRPSRRA